MISLDFFTGDIMHAISIHEIHKSHGITPVSPIIALISGAVVFIVAEASTSPRNTLISALIASLGVISVAVINRLFDLVKKKNDFKGMEDRISILEHSIEEKDKEIRELKDAKIHWKSKFFEAMKQDSENQS